MVDEPCDAVDIGGNDSVQTWSTGSGDCEGVEDTVFIGFMDYMQYYIDRLSLKM
jgi:hypothetical protein